MGRALLAILDHRRSVARPSGGRFPKFAEVPIVSNRATAAMARAWIDPAAAMATVPSGMLGRVQMPAR